MTYVMYDVAHVTSEVYQTNGWVLLSLILQQTDKQTIQHNTRDMNIKQEQTAEHHALISEQRAKMAEHYMQIPEQRQSLNK